MNTSYANAVGVTMPIALTNQDGSPVDLSQAGTVVNLQFYAFGTNKQAWAHDNLTGGLVIDDAINGLAHYTTVAADFATVGDYFTLILVTYASYSQTFVGQSWSIITQQQSVITPAELLTWMDLPAETAKPTATIQTYIDDADKQLLLEVPLLASNTNTQIVQFRQRCVRTAAAISYFMNSSEQNVNPEIRLQKIKLWSEMYWNAVDKLNSILSNTSGGESTVRRVQNTSAADTSPLSQDYYP